MTATRRRRLQAVLDDLSQETLSKVAGKTVEIRISN